MKNKKKRALENVTRDSNQYGNQKGIPGSNNEGLTKDQIEYLIREAKWMESLIKN